MKLGWISLWAALAGPAVAAVDAPRVLDDFRDASSWQATASDQVRATLRRDRDGSLCLDYDFAGVSGYAVMRRELPVDWPAHFDLVPRLKGAGATNDLQVKLVDASGDNVWWVHRPNARLPAALQDLKLRRRHVEFAWGPTTDRRLAHTRFVEFVIAAGRDGGRGSLCVARLTLVERAPDPATWPEPQVRASAAGLDLDHGRPREFNGLALRWPPAQRPGFAYDVLASDDGRRWRVLRRVRGSDGGLDALWLPESEARWLRIRPSGEGGRPATQPTVELRSAAQWPTIDRLIAELAADAPQGDLPRAYRGQQNYWALVGVDGGGSRSALISEDGAIEVGRGGFSLEPVVTLGDGTRVTWAQVSSSHTLQDGYLPIPRVRWAHAGFTLDVEAAADGPRDAPSLLARYVLRNTTTQPQALQLALAVRPWQVNPPQQFLATPGGSSPIRLLRHRDGLLTVDDRRHLRFTRPPARATAAPFDGGLSLAALEAAAPLTVMADPQRLASAHLAWRFTLAPGEAVTLGWTAGLGTPAVAAGTAPPPITAAVLDARVAAVAGHWRARLNRTQLQLPPDAQPIADSLRTALAHMLMSREGPSLRPGTRSYNRSWVRDGAMMVAGLVRLGEIDASREFIDWYRGFVFDSGKVPCCVDQRGADPVVENDSHGQYLFTVAEVWRHTGDAAFLQRHWPTVQRVMAWMEALRQSERTDANRVPGRTHYFGLMPPSISHEGYSDKPAYSYWDDFWALRGYKDAVQVAQALGQLETARTWAAQRDEFERELAASIEATARHHGIGFIAGAADRGDFDATSTTMALNPAQAAVPPALLRATFERYWAEMSARSAGTRAYKDYTPYELRTVGALARLGWPERAHAMLDFFFRDQRPRGWNQWAEVVLPDAREVRFLGDMPHAWVASDYVRSALDLFAHEREADAALVVGAGLRPEWLAHPGGVALRGLSTPWGRFDIAITPVTGGWTVALPQALPGARGGVHLHWPAGLPRPRAWHEGRVLDWSADGTLRLPDGPATIHLRSEGAPRP